MTDTDIEQDLFESIDIAPPCEYSAHDEVGSGSAAWVIWYAPVNGCGCPAITRITMICDACWSWRNEDGKVWCDFDLHEISYMDGIVRIERLK